MKSLDQLAQEVALKGIDGELEVNTMEYYTKISEYLKEFEKFRYERDLPVHITFPVSKDMSTDDDIISTGDNKGYMDMLANSMTGIACSMVTAISGIDVIFIIFSLDNFSKELTRQGITKVSEVFLKRSVFSVLAHEYFHCRENGKYLKEIMKAQKENPLPHDEDTEEINADLYAISVLKQI